jgi:hypothetical protein
MHFSKKARQLDKKFNAVENKGLLGITASYTLIFNTLLSPFL